MLARLLFVFQCLVCLIVWLRPLVSHCGILARGDHTKIDDLYSRKRSLAILGGDWTECGPHARRVAAALSCFGLMLYARIPSLVVSQRMGPLWPLFVDASCEGFHIESVDEDAGGGWVAGFPSGFRGFLLLVPKPLRRVALLLGPSTVRGNLSFFLSRAGG